MDTYVPTYLLNTEPDCVGGRQLDTDAQSWLHNASCLMETEYGRE